MLGSISNLVGSTQSLVFLTKKGDMTGILFLGAPLTRSPYPVSVSIDLSFYFLSTAVLEKCPSIFSSFSFFRKLTEKEKNPQNYNTGDIQGSKTDRFNL